MDYDTDDSTKAPVPSDDVGTMKRRLKRSSPPAAFITSSAVTSYPMSPPKMMINSAPKYPPASMQMDDGAQRLLDSSATSTFLPPPPRPLPSNRFIISPTAFPATETTTGETTTKSDKVAQDLLAALIGLLQKQKSSGDEEPQPEVAYPATSGNTIADIPIVGQQLNDFGFQKTLTKYGGKISDVLHPRLARQSTPGAAGSGGGWDSSKWMSSGSSWNSGQGINMPQSFLSGEF